MSNDSDRSDDLPTADPSTSFSDGQANSISKIGPGRIISGRYELLRSIGQGGMGSVWLAQQSEPVKRQVAVKLIKAGMDSHQVMARFDAERQALAVKPKRL